MQTSIWEKIADTPWWFSLVIIGFVGIAWLATKPKTVPVKNLFFVPAIYIPLSVASICLTIPLNAIAILLWLGAALLGIAVGWLHYRLIKIKAVKNQASLYVPGTWSIFGLLLVVAVSKYYYDYPLMIDPQLFAQAEYANLFVGLYGLFAGIFIGKIIYSLRCVKNGPFVAH